MDATLSSAGNEITIPINNLIRQYDYVSGLMLPKGVGGREILYLVTYIRNHLYKRHRESLTHFINKYNELIVIPSIQNGTYLTAIYYKSSN